VRQPSEFVLCLHAHANSHRQPGAPGQFRR